MEAFRSHLAFRTSLLAKHIILTLHMAFRTSHQVASSISFRSILLRGTRAAPASKELTSSRPVRFVVCLPLPGLLAPCLLRRPLLRRIGAAPALKVLEVLIAVGVFCATAVFAMVDTSQPPLTRPGRLEGTAEDPQVLSTTHANLDDIVPLLSSVGRSKTCGTFAPL